MARGTRPTPPPPPPSPSLEISSWFGGRETLDSILSQLIEGAGDQHAVTRDAVLQMMPNAPPEAYRQMEAALNARKYDVVDFYSPATPPSAAETTPTTVTPTDSAADPAPSPAPASARRPRSPQPAKPVVDPIADSAGRSLDYASVRDFR